ncbi:MAG: hypothetical protein B7Z73_01535 [Planctomycetia bacterium 21-64-5]|nr:MAG: hypothetical protein B7Z73_01535 [Planctomycetia bacterium 21-64-5]HQU42485.1 hypothetical protein [Pirellulales bacterium]
MQIRRFAIVVVFLSAFAFVVECRILREASSIACAEEPEDDAVKKLALERKERYSKWMREYAEGTQIELKGGNADDNGDPKLAEMVPNPVLRYSDEEHRIPDATLWVWTSDGRPVAFQKVEGNDHGGGQQWTICFTSLSEGPVKVKWPMDRSFTSQGVTFRPIPGAEIPSENARLRTAQIKALKEQFSARFWFNANGKGGSEARILPTPLFEYSDPKTTMPWGAVFDMSSTGTNPSALLLIDARHGEAGRMQWHYGFARMTAVSVRASLNNVEVWSEPGASKFRSGRWTYFFLPRDFR